MNIDSSLWLDKLKKEITAGKYSRRTVKLYLEYKRELLKFLEKAPYQISNDDAKNYRYYLAEKKNASASTLNTEINALKFCYG